MRKQCIILKYRIYISRLRRKSGHIPAIQKHLTGIRHFQPCNNTKSCCLAASGRTQKCDEFSLSNRKADFLQNGFILRKGLPDIF